MTIIYIQNKKDMKANSNQISKLLTLFLFTMLSFGAFSQEKKEKVRIRIEQEADGKTKDRDCVNPGACPLSACEQRIIALSVRNRAQNLDCQARNFGCQSVGDYAGVATRPDQYNIWSPAMASEVAISHSRQPHM